MKNYSNIEEFFDEKGPPEIERFIDTNLNISQVVYNHLHGNDITVKHFADLLNESEETVRYWLTGTHDLSLLEISKMETVLVIDVIKVQCSSENQDFSIMASLSDIVEKFSPETIEITEEKKQYEITEISIEEGETFGFVVYLTKDQYSKIKENFKRINEEIEDEVFTIVRSEHTHETISAVNRYTNNHYLDRINFYKLNENINLDYFEYEEFPSCGNGLVKISENNPIYG
jgi:hypothetical protein